MKSQVIEWYSLKTSGNAQGLVKPRNAHPAALYVRLDRVPGDRPWIGILTDLSLVPESQLEPAYPDRLIHLL